MYTSINEVLTMTGVEIDQTTLNLAQMMIETFTGRDEAEVEGASDLNTLGRATIFQAVYIKDNKLDMLEQAALTQIATSEERVSFDTRLFGPYLSPWSAKACQKLSWFSTRTVRTGKIFGKPGYEFSWRSI